MNATDPRIDRLYSLLPAIHRIRDADNGYPLRALLQVIAEQVNVVEDDIAGLYQNWFIETCDDWVVPYIGDLVGYVAVPDAEPAPDSVGDAPRVLVPRREVANLIRSRRRKGTLALLEQLANDVAGWPARAVEFFRLLGWTQNIDHLHLHRHRLADLRNVEALELLNGPFDETAHSVDVRRINSARTVGRYNIPSVGVFVWRLNSYTVTRTAAYCVEDVGPQCFSFSVLGQDVPLFVHPQPEVSPTHIAQELNLPVRIRRSALERRIDDFYGLGKSFAIWADGWGGYDPQQPLPAAVLQAADLSDWTYVPQLNHVAVDPVLGRIAFPPSQLPKKGVRVSYCYGFSAEMGGGEYARALEQPPDATVVNRLPDGKPYTDVPGTIALYRVGPDDQSFHKFGDALTSWAQDKPVQAIIEFAVSAVYVEPINIELAAGQYLQIRAANRARPVLRMIDWQTDASDAMAVTLGERSRLVLDGLLITGRPVQITGAARVEGSAPAYCAAEVVIRHCTLVPGWAIECDCQPKRPTEPSLQLTNVRARICIDHSIVGSIQVHEDEIAFEPIPLSIADSIVDSTSATGTAIGPVGTGWAHVQANIQRCTVFGIVDVRAMELAENSIFTACVNVGRRQLGCMRFCYVPAGCRTPRRHACQPDGVISVVKSEITNAAELAAAIKSEKLRVTPQFTSVRYGAPGYAQLGAHCAAEIVRGADDESEMGAFHDLMQPQRAANLRARLAEYTAAGMNAGLILVS